MTGLIAVLALAAIIFWLFGGKRAPRETVPVPEDDVTTPIDEDELAEAEGDLAEDTDPQTLGEEDDDDWGPGAGQR